MKLEHTKEFDKSVRKLNDKIALTRLDKILDELENAQNLREISDVLPLKDRSKLYRITRGDFRLIVKYKQTKVVIILIDYRRRNEKTYKGLN
jgi:mRNA interferase RelE/StbE